jgi:hypothetical protein
LGDDPKTAADLLDAIEAIQTRLAEIDEELPRVLTEHANATATRELVYHRARLESTTEFPKRKVDEHDTHAILATRSHQMVDPDTGEVDEDPIDIGLWLLLVDARKRALTAEGHDLRSILSGYQTVARWFADDAGHGRYGRGGR